MSIVSNYILIRVQKLENEYKTLAKVPKNHEMLIEIQNKITQSKKEGKINAKNFKGEEYYKKWYAVKEFYMNLQCKNKRLVTAKKFGIPKGTLDTHVLRWNRGSLKV